MSQSESKVAYLLEDYQGLEVIPYEECKTLLRDARIGRVGFVANAETVLLPVNAVFVQGSVMFRSAPGSKLDCAELGLPMSFQIDDWDDTTRTGWSVLATGVADVIDDQWLLKMYEVLKLEPWAGPREHWVRIRLDEISGRRIVST